MEQLLSRSLGNIEVKALIREGTVSCVAGRKFFVLSLEELVASESCLEILIISLMVFRTIYCLSEALLVSHSWSKGMYLSLYLIRIFKMDTFVNTYQMKLMRFFCALIILWYAPWIRSRICSNLIWKCHEKFLEHFSIDEYQLSRCTLCSSSLSCATGTWWTAAIMVPVSATFSKVLQKKSIRNTMICRMWFSF